MPASHLSARPRRGRPTQGQRAGTRRPDQRRDGASTRSAAPASGRVRTERHTRRPVADSTPPAVIVAPDNGFAALGLPTRVVEQLAREGKTAPFDIQTAAIPDAMSGRDVLGRAQTGSGKTLAFGLPVLARLTGGRSRSRHPRAVVLVPTRELAMQVHDSLEPLAHASGLQIMLVAGGMPYQRQIRGLDHGVDLLVATPGRLTDLVERGSADLSAVEVVVLDEADHMCDMGFLPAVSDLLDLMPGHGQRLLFSATLDGDVDTIVRRYLHDPVTHSTADAQASVSTMDHHVWLVKPAHKAPVTAALAARDGRTVVFVRTKLGADRVAEQLRQQGIRAAALHGGLTQGVRSRTLDGFRHGHIPVLVATDVAARGIHVDDVGLVVQADPPADHKDYLHRAGRTARAGEKGTVITLALPHQRRVMERLTARAGVQAPGVAVEPRDSHLRAITGGAEPNGVKVEESELFAFRQQRRPSGKRAPRPQRDNGRPAGTGTRREPRPRRDSAPDGGFETSGYRSDGASRRAPRQQAAPSRSAGRRGQDSRWDTAPGATGRRGKDTRRGATTPRATSRRDQDTRRTKRSAR